MDIRKAVIFLLPLAMISMKLAAQVNPQKGYIITNDNDTIQGTIDYLTDEKNARACLFQKAGESEYKSLYPGDIKGYRLADDGIYYVSRMFTGEEKQVQLFAEFLLQGSVSLYLYYYDLETYFGFVDSDGKEVIIRNDKLNEDLSTYNHKLQQRRQKMQEVNRLMNQDNTIANRLWKMDLTSENLTRLVKQYDEEYCTEQGECVLFRYDKEKTTTVSHRFYVGAGVSYASYGSPTYDNSAINDRRFSEYTYTGIAPTFFVGADFQFPRFSRSLTAQMELSYTPHRYESSEVTTEGGKAKLSINEMACRVGIRYMFSPESSIKPFIMAGLHLAWNMGMKEENVSYRYRNYDNSVVSQGVIDLDHGNQMKGGIYLGAGVDISHIRINAFWKKAMGGKEGPNEKNCGILTLAYLF